MPPPTTATVSRSPTIIDSSAIRPGRPAHGCIFTQSNAVSPSPRRWAETPPAYQEVVQMCATPSPHPFFDSRCVAALALALIVSAPLPEPAHAQDYPDRIVKIIVP